MARKNRVWYPGAIYHVMNRGNRKALIYQDEGDCLYFLNMVKTVKKTYPFTIHSICLMRNHFHIELETETVEPGKIMSKILTPYSMFYNRKYALNGHLFGGRYKSSLIESDAYFLEVSRYIHMNPVKAKMVKSPLDYEYSSYPLYVSDKETRNKGIIERTIEDIVDTSRILDCFGNDRERYREFVEGAQAHDESETLIMKDIGEDEMWLPK